MKAFLKKIAAYLFILIFLFLPVVLYTSERVGEEVDEAMQLATKRYPFKIKKIRLGDSVGKNLWKTGYDSAAGEVNLTCNQAISLLGHVLLLRAILRNNKTDSSLTIEAYFRPSSILISDLNQKYTRGYFLKKFYNRQWFFNKDIAPADSVMTSIDRVFLRQYGERPLYKYLYFNGRCLVGSPYFFEKRPFENSGLRAHLYKELLPELKGIKFISTPVAYSFRDEQWKAYQLVKRDLSITQPVFLADSFFIEDRAHLKLQFRERGSGYFVNLPGKSASPTGIRVQPSFR